MKNEINSLNFSWVVTSSDGRSRWMTSYSINTINPNSRDSVLIHIKIPYKYTCDLNDDGNLLKAWPHKINTINENRTLGFKETHCIWVLAAVCGLISKRHIKHKWLFENICDEYSRKHFHKESNRETDHDANNTAS